MARSLGTCVGYCSLLLRVRGKYDDVLNSPKEYIHKKPSSTGSI